MTKLADDFSSLPSEYQDVLRLAQDTHNIDLTPLQELKGGRTGAYLYLVSGSPIPPRDDEGGNTLYRNRGDGTFEDVTVPAGARVDSAEISIGLENSSGGFYHLFEMRRDWRESQATWTRFASGESWKVW